MSNSEIKLNKCICSGKSLDRMLRPAVLTVLEASDEGLHGYAIDRELCSFSFFKQRGPDYTGLYRLLKRMEKEGLLCSTESDSHSGPAKRIYKLTPRGRTCLSRWLDSLQEYREMLDDLLSHAQEAMEIAR
ncbi:MAG: helix-turn-helix transcriptional regulator [Sedimentisphaerales bacterium]|nr:helix-turn-helix transcriptional regulator [Sedimentisphaerales bacterium]